jgi:uncharacterized protein YndB with AHSA1/START domain
MAVDDMPPGGISIERSIMIAAPSRKVFQLVGDLHTWERWNPNGMGDPTVERTYGGSSSGYGATMDWRGKRSGAGRMEVLSATEPSEIVVAVDFEKPFKLRNINRFRLEPLGAATTLTWAIQGPKPLMAKVLGLFFSMDKMMARHCDAGLVSLKALAES